MTQDFAKPSTSRAPKTPSQDRARSAAKQKKPVPTKHKNTQSKAKSTQKKPQGTSKPQAKKPNTQAKKPSIQPKKPSIELFFALKLMLLVALVAGATWGIYLLGSIPPAKQTEVQSPVPASKPSKPATPKTTISPKTKPNHYDFYDILPKAKVTPAPEAISHYTPKSKDGDPYLRLLQTGSFRNKQDAEAQRAKIAFLGIKAVTKEVTSKSGSTWYRVETTPFTSRSRLNGAIDKLVNINIRPLEKKIKQ